MNKEILLDQRSFLLGTWAHCARSQPEANFSNRARRQNFDGFDPNLDDPEAKIFNWSSLNFFASDGFETQSRAKNFFCLQQMMLVCFASGPKKFFFSWFFEKNFRRFAPIICLRPKNFYFLVDFSKKISGASRRWKMFLVPTNNVSLFWFQKKKFFILIFQKQFFRHFPPTMKKKVFSCLRQMISSCCEANVNAFVFFSKVKIFRNQSFVLYQANNIWIIFETQIINYTMHISCVSLKVWIAMITLKIEFYKDCLFNWFNHGTSLS